MYQKLQKYSTENHEWFLTYKWLKIFCMEWVHEKVFSEFLLLHPKKDAKILILWSWTWAFDQRLLDNWFCNITSSDFLNENYSVKWTTFMTYDLNNIDRDLWSFDYIFAIEVIEHLENQFNFIRNANKALNNGWYLLLSTPNITNQYSKANFIVKWQLAQFSEIDLSETGHISIIAPHIFLFNTEQNWFKLIKRTNEGKSKLKLTTHTKRAFFWYFVYKILMLFLWGNKNRNDIYILKKS
jgi:hypothetical protein